MRGGDRYGGFSESLGRLIRRLVQWVSQLEFETYFILIIGTLLGIVLSALYYQVFGWRW
jgi:hypothetical protein